MISISSSRASMLRNPRRKRHDHRQQARESPSSLRPPYPSSSRNDHLRSEQAPVIVLRASPWCSEPRHISTPAPARDICCQSRQGRFSYLRTAASNQPSHAALMRQKGLEPLRLAAHAPKACASAIPPLAHYRQYTTALYDPYPLPAAIFPGVTQPRLIVSAPLSGPFGDCCDDANRPMLTTVDKLRGTPTEEPTTQTMYGKRQPPAP